MRPLNSVLSLVSSGYRAAFIIVGLLGAAVAQSATYYVDPVMGNNANAGTSQTVAWRTIPGWSGSTSHGPFNSSNKVPVGTVIELKAGSQLNGGRLLVDGTYYALPASDAQRIRIQVSTTWGSGNFVIDGRGASVPQWNGGVQVTNISYVTIAGADASRRIEIKNYAGHSGILYYRSGTGSARSVGNQLLWFDVHHNSNYCVNTTWQDGMLIQDGFARDCGAIEGGASRPASGAGVIIGDVADAGGANNVVRRVKAYRNAVGAARNDGSIAFGFQHTGAMNLLFDSCEAYGNGRDGFDGGRADNAGDSSATFVNSYSHDNGEDGFALNSGPTGTVVARHINSIATRNGQANWTPAAPRS
jgi:hypothetical protein